MCVYFQGDMYGNNKNGASLLKVKEKTQLPPSFWIEIQKMWMKIKKAKVFLLQHLQDDDVNNEGDAKEGKIEN